MRTAAHNMVRHLAAGMAMITCREPLLLAISTNLKTAFTGLLRVSGHLSGSEGQGKLSSLLGPLSRLILPLFALFPPPPCAPPPQPSSEEQKVMIEQASQQLSADNTELACAFIQKMAVEKAISEIDKRLCEVSVWGVGGEGVCAVLADTPSPQEFEARKQARSEGRRYLNPAMMQYQAERLPEQLRSKVSGQGKERGRRGLSGLQVSCDDAAVLTATASPPDCWSLSWPVCRVRGVCTLLAGVPSLCHAHCHHHYSWSRGKPLP